MKIRLLMIAASLLMGSVVASAQQSKTDESLEFRPNWSLGVQGGVAHTRGEVSFTELLSPAAQLSMTYNFHHAMGVRLGLGGWQGKGAALTDKGYRKYAFMYGQLSADYLLDLAGVFGGFNHKRVVNPYLLAGVGLSYGFDNTQADAYADVLEYHWGKKLFVPVRAGLGVDFRISDYISFNIEGDTNIYSDKFNSKRADNVDWQFNMLAGLKFRFGKNTRPSQAYADRIAAEEAAAAAARAAEAEAARLAEEKAAREAAERAAAEKAAAEKAAREAAERAAAERAAKAADNSDNVYFTIGSYVIRKDEAAKVERLAEWMKANADFTVSLVGYADKETGTAKGNVKLSENRVNVVKELLVKCGVSPDRIVTDYKGDTVQPFAVNEKNRVVTCVLE